jgi:hypothetical protein
MIKAVSCLCLIDGDDARTDVSVGKQQQTKENIFLNIFFFCSKNKEKGNKFILIIFF